MKKPAVIAALLGVLVALGSSAAFAQVRQLYWSTSGLFGPFPNSGLIPNLPKERQRDVQIPVSMWIIDHAKGLVVFDTGNNVAISDGNCKKYWAAGFCDLLLPNQKREDVIDMQLQKLGYSTDRVKAVITSHSHLDHMGNIKMFPKAIHVIQKKELYQAWWPEKFQRGPAFVMQDFDGAAVDFNYLELEGDYDLFGDGRTALKTSFSKYHRQYDADPFLAYADAGVRQENRNWFDCSFWVEVLSARRSCFCSLIRFSISPRAQYSCS